MDVLGIVKKYLEDNGFDGLHCDSECGCKLDSLIPCGEMVPDCEAGYLQDCQKCERKTGDTGCASGFDFCIGSSKENNDCGKS